MLTVDFTRFPLAAGDRVLDLGCGAGRHAFECYRRGAQVVALDQNGEEIREVAKWFAAMKEAGEAPEGATATAMEGDALNLPFPDESFDVVIISEVMEHIPDDKGVLAEMVRVLRPGGRIAITVPRYGPEKVCWTLSDAYHEVEGGHIRIYKADELLGKIRGAASSRTAPTTPTPCTRRTGGSSAHSGWAATARTQPCRFARTTSCWSGTS